MRLLNADTLQLEEFFDDRIPEYAILSHRSAFPLLLQTMQFSN